MCTFLIATIVRSYLDLVHEISFHVLLQHLLKFHRLHAEIIVLHINNLFLQALNLPLIVNLAFRFLAIEFLDFLQHTGLGCLCSSQLPPQITHHLITLLLLLPDELWVGRNHLLAVLAKVNSPLFAAHIELLHPLC